MATDEEIMSKKYAVLIVSRAFALYFFCWAADNLTYLPGRIHSLSYHRSVLYSENYFHRSDMISLLSLIIRVVVLVSVTIWFYGSGSRLQSFFIPSKERRTETCQVASTPHLPLSLGGGWLHLVERVPISLKSGKRMRASASVSRAKSKIPRLSSGATNQ